jgi:2-hydroxy-6-oxonona-2,4-dienedioate hydrolase
MRLASRSSLLLFSILLVCASGIWIYIRYSRDLQAANGRLEGTSKVIETASGPIEYAVVGEGKPLLMVHGSGGGFDQGLDFALTFAGKGYQVIAVSRFGYLGTPYPKDASPEAQADAHANLLTALGIERAAILGASAGGPSTMQFAIRHPDKCAAMILLVPLAWKPETVSSSAPKISPWQEKIITTLVGSDFVFWAATKLAPDLLMRKVLATPNEDFDAAPEAEKARINTMMNHILPISRRIKGLMNDSVMGASLQRYDLEKITAPVLSMSVKDDLYGTYATAQYTASQIPGARFVGFDKGGHVWAGHGEEAYEIIRKFLDGVDLRGSENARKGPSGR